MCFLLSLTATAGAQQTQPGRGLELYRALKNAQLSGGASLAENLVLKRDRAEMTFDGKFYFQPASAGAVRGAVFMGRGKFRAEVPPDSFERDNVRRMLKTDIVESDFQTAVLRFTDDTFNVIGGKVAAAESAPAEAQKLDTDFDSAR